MVKLEIVALGHVKIHMLSKHYVGPLESWKHYVGPLESWKHFVGSLGSWKLCGPFGELETLEGPLENYAYSAPNGWIVCGEFNCRNFNFHLVTHPKRRKTENRDKRWLVLSDAKCSRRTSFEKNVNTEHKFLR